MDDGDRRLDSAEHYPDGQLDDVWADDAAPPPEWVFTAALEQSLKDLTSAADHPFTPDDVQVFSRVVAALESTDPGELAAESRPDAILDGIRASSRLINHLQALQRKWTVAFARPGVAVNAEALVDACAGAGNRLAAPFVTPDSIPDDLPTLPNGTPDYSTLVEHPAWKPALANGATRVASVELAAALGIAPITARLRTERAVHIVDGLPAVHRAQLSGEIDGFRTTIIAEETACLSRDDGQAVADQILPKATELTPGRLREAVKRNAIATDPEAAHRRRRDARASRGVRVEPSDSDMAVFKALLNASDAQVAYGVLDSVAVSLTAAGLADGRGTSQLRADVFADIFHTLATTGQAHIDTKGSQETASGPDEVAHGGAPQEAQHALRSPKTGAIVGLNRGCDGATVHASGPSVQLNVYITAETLAGLDEAPGELDGYGSITADTARALAASANTIRALVRNAAHVHTGADARSSPSPGADPGTEPNRDPAHTHGHAHAHGHAHHNSPQHDRPWSGIHESTGVRAAVCDTVINAGRSVYRPPTALADYVTARDRRCQFPGCRAAARRCDIDHRHPFDSGGATCGCNVDLLCRFHHRIKTFTPWRASPDPRTGRLVWTSPTGRTYAKENSHPIVDHVPAQCSPAGAAPNQPPGRPPDEPPPF